jgi:hypothetical protein
VIPLSEEFKPAAELGQRMTLSQPQPPSPPLDDDELQMRRALGLFGATPKQRPEPERSEQPSRGPGTGGFPQGGGGMHRRRFVQDGEVPVTVVRRDDPANNPLAPQSSRLQRVEAALAAETAARDRAERALLEAQASVQALRTKIGHAELEKNEAINAAKRDRDEVVALREERAGLIAGQRDARDRVEALEAELSELRDELADQRQARERAERLLAEMSEQPAAPPVAKAPVRRAHVTTREPELDLEPEGEPVKWWLPVQSAPKATPAAKVKKASPPAAKAKPKAAVKASSKTQAAKKPAKAKGGRR